MQPYGGDAEDGYGTGFTLKAPVTFSVHTREGTLPPGTYDVRIESNPPGDYIYTDVVSLETFLTIVAKLHGPEEHWPGLTD